MALGSLATNAAIAGVGLITGSLAARLLGPHGRGELASIQNVPVLLAGLALFGMPSALTYYSAKNRDASRSLYASAVVVALAASIPLIAFGWFLLPSLVGKYGGHIVTSARVYLLFLPLQAVQALPYSALLGVGEIGTWNLLRLLPNIAWLTALGIGGALGLSDASRIAMIYLFLYAATAPVSTAALLRNVRHGRLRPAVTPVRQLIRFGAPGALAVVPFQLNLRLDQVAMAALLPASDLGMYAVAVSWSGVIAPVLGAVAPLLLPLMARGDLDERQRRAAATRTTRLSMLLSFGVTVVVVIVTPLAVPLLFGERFAGATMPAIILTLAAGCAGLNTLLEELLKGLGAPRWPLYGQIASLPVTVILLVLLLAKYTSIGAAVASLSAYGVTTAVLLGGMKKLTRMQIWALCMPRVSEILEMARALAAAVRLRRVPDEESSRERIAR